MFLAPGKIRKTRAKSEKYGDSIKIRTVPDPEKNLHDNFDNILIQISLQIEKRHFTIKFGIFKGRVKRSRRK